MTEYQGEKFLNFIQKTIKEDKSKPKHDRLTMNKVIEMLSVSKTAVYSYFKSKNLSRETVQKITSTFNATEHEIFGIESSNDFTLSQTFDTEPATTKKGNAIFIGDLEDQEDSDGNTKFIEISPGRYRMKVDLVPTTARAGWLSGFEDPTHLEELPKHEVTVTKYHKGKYTAFESEGDSMDDGSIESIPDGCVITGRDIRRELWTSKLHVHRFPNWIFAHKTEGVVVKRIKSQNLLTGDIVLYGLNPDKVAYPDIHINLDDVYKIFNVVKRELD